MHGKAAFLASALAAALAPDSDSARAADAGQASCSLHVQEQALDRALAQIALQCGVQLIYFSRLTQGKAGSALDGSYSVEAALQKLLAGTGLAFRQVNANTIEIRTAPAVQTADSSSKDTGPQRDRRRQLSGHQDGSGLPEVVIGSTIEGLVATRTRTS